MYDLAVIGGGLSGLIAGYQGAANGLKTIILEKGRSIGGSGNYVEGFFAIGTKYQAEKGLHYDIKDIYNEEMEYSHYEADSKTVMSYIKKSKENLEYLQEKMGVEITEVLPMGNSKATWHLMKGFGREQISKHIVPSIKKQGGEILTSTAGIKIVQDDNKKVTGLLVEDENTHETRKIEAKAVIIASGGFLNNPKLLGEETGYDPNLMIPVNSGKSTGDGVRMAWQVGAQRDYKGAVMSFGGYIKDPDKPTYYYYSKQLGNAVKGQGLLLVNGHGDRFVNEGIYSNRAYYGNAFLQQNKIYSIADQKTLDTLANDHVFIKWAAFNEDVHKPYTHLKEELDEAIKNKAKFLHVADSIDDLAKQINLPDLPKTVARYNALAKKGEDEDFFKDAKLIHPVQKGPFYAFELGVGTLTSLGGLKTDQENRVLDKNSEPIPGLYAVGTDAYGKMMGDTYGFNLPGSCAGYCLYSGLNAADDAKRYIEG